MSLTDPATNLATGSHGVYAEVTFDPVGAPGVYTRIAEVMSDLTKGIARPSVETTPHESGTDTFIHSNVARRPEITFDVNWVWDNVTHSAAAGMLKLELDKTIVLLKMIGAKDVPVAGEDEWIFSVIVTNVELTDAIGDAQRVGSFTVQPTGPMCIDGVTYS